MQNAAGGLEFAAKTSRRGLARVSAVTSRWRARAASVVNANSIAVEKLAIAAEMPWSSVVPRDTDAILIVEDSEADALLFRTALEEAGVMNPLIHTSNYEETVKYLTGWGQYIDRNAFPFPVVIFLDIHMPGKNGFEILHWIRENAQTQQLVVIMMSGSASQADISRSYAEGANSYLLKPSVIEDLVKTLTHFRRYWLEMNRYP
jgi:two-component system response regulator